jgi:hypothetical protein
MFFQKPLPTLILSLVLLGACVSPSVPPPDAVPPSDTLPSDTAGRPDVLQVANDLPKTPLRPKRSQELEDSGIGIDLLTYHADACDTMVIRWIGSVLKWSPESIGLTLLSMT